MKRLFTSTGSNKFSAFWCKVFILCAFVIVFITNVGLSQTADALFFDDFEGGLGNWLVSGQDWDTVSIDYSSPIHSIHSNPGGNYPPWANASITLADVVDLSATNVPVLTFWHKFKAGTNVDLCRVEISEDYGFNWSEITTFTGTNNTWNLVQLDLSAYKSSPIKIRFRLTSDGNYEFFGWLIDDVELKDLNPTNLNDSINKIPKVFSLQQNYPNPFNPSTEIKYQLPDAGFITLKVYDVLGNEVANLVNEEKLAGSYEVEFQSAVGGRQLASGIYFYKLQAGIFLETKKMILLK